MYAVSREGCFTMKIAVAQLDPCVGDLDANLDAMLLAAQMASRQEAELLVFPNAALTGAPIDGLASSAAFVKDARAHLQRFAQETQVLSLVAGLSEIDKGRGRCDVELFACGDGVATSMGVPAQQADDSCPALVVGGLNVAVLLGRHFARGVKLSDMDVLVEMCADAFGSPYAARAALGQLGDLSSIATSCGAHVVAANLCGAADACVFSGNSAVLAPDGRLVHASPIDEAEIFTFDTQAGQDQVCEDFEAARVEPVEAVWRAVKIATRDYVRKNGFTDVVVGLSGGIDSAVVATIAADALGAEHVHGVAMPGPYSSPGSVSDAHALAENLGCEIVDVPIDGPLAAFHEALGEPCGGEVAGLAAENLQARVRCVHLMTLANAHGRILLNTGNKSEAAMGFSTLYGDTAGAFAPIGDLYKSEVYALARWRASQGASIPQASIDKAPSAELYPDARDADRLPPYDVLDAILFDHVEEEMGAAALVAAGHDEELVRHVVAQVQASEFKRRQEPLAPHVQGCALTTGRAWPVTNGWVDNS